MSALNRQYESMTRLQWDAGGVHTVRVWVTESTLRTGPRVDVMEALRAPWPTPETVAAALDLLRQQGVPIAAFEILDAAGDGCVVYPDWE